MLCVLYKYTILFTYIQTKHQDENKKKNIKYKFFSNSQIWKSPRWCGVVVEDNKKIIENVYKLLNET